VARSAAAQSKPEPSAIWRFVAAAVYPCDPNAFTAHVVSLPVQSSSMVLRSLILAALAMLSPLTVADALSRLPRMPPDAPKRGNIPHGMRIDWWWTGVVVFGLALWIVAYMVVPTW
jgi:hypothetical protein